MKKRGQNKAMMLIEAAQQLIYQQGYYVTTLADIALQSGVPLGNVYYYYQTKELIGVAVIEKWQTEWSERLSYLEEMTTPAERLMVLVEHDVKNIEAIMQFGCPIGSLCQEMARERGILSEKSTDLMREILFWSKRQFREMGLGDKSQTLAIHFISSMQGMCLLSYALKDVRVMKQTSQTLKAWLRHLVEDKAPPVNVYRKQEKASAVEMA